MSDLTWQQVTSAPEWGGLEPTQRDQMRQKFFADVIQPNIPDGTDAGGVQKDFFSRTQTSMQPAQKFGLSSVGNWLGRAGRAAEARALDLGADLQMGINPGGAIASQITGLPSDYDRIRALAQDVAPAPAAKGDVGARSADFVGGFVPDIAAAIATGGASELPEAASLGSRIGAKLIGGARAMALPAAENTRETYNASVGLTPAQAAARAAVAGGSTLLTGALPASAPGGLATRLVTGAAIGAGTNEAQRAAMNAVTPDNRPDLQQGFDPVADALSGLAGGAFGGALGGRRLQHGDDLLAAHNANTANATEDPATHAVAPAAAPTTADLIDPDVRLRDTHGRRVADLAEQMKLDPDQARAVTEHLTPAAPRDPVTGFYTSQELTPTLQAAQAHVESTGQPARYAEIDVRNLGGLNAAIGHTAADSVLNELATNTHEELRDAGASVIPIRRGGDEYGYIVVGGEPDKVQAALDNATAGADDIAKQYGIDSIPHPKGGPAGVGIVAAHEPIVPGQDLAEMFRNIDQRIESQKVGESDYGNGTTATTQRSAPESAGASEVSAEPGREETGGGSQPPGREVPRTLGDASGEQAEVAPLPEGVTITPIGNRIRVGGSKQYAETLRNLGVRVGASEKGQHYSFPAEQESVVREALADHADSNQLQAASMFPSSDSLVKAADAAIASRKANGVLHDMLMKVSPMAASGNPEAQAIVKDYANAQRLARHEGVQADRALTSKFSNARLEKMWSAADEHSVLQQRGDSTDGKGLDTLAPDERAAVEKLQGDAQAAFEEAKRVGIVGDDVEGLPSYVPRMLVRMTDAGAKRFSSHAGAESAGTGGVRTFTANLLGRKHLTAAETEAAAKVHDDNAEIVKNIRTLPLATSKLRESIAGRRLINAIEEAGKRAGVDTVAKGHDPSKADDRWFTMPENAAFYTMRPRTVKAPIREAFDQHLWDGLHKLATQLGVSPQRVAAMRGGRWGEAGTDGSVTTRFGGPETVLTHELGHQLDWKYGLADFLTRRGATAKELRALADLRYEGSAASEGFKKYVRKGTEKIANLVHAYVHMPDRLREVAPHTFDAFEKFLAEHPELGELKKLKPSLVLGSRSQDVPVTQWERVPLYIRGDFEGPLRAVLSERPGAMYRAMMTLKAKTMALIMYSPIIHNAVEFGRALPALPGKVVSLRVYIDGNRAKNDPGVMREAINAGLAPIGGHGAFNDIESIAESPNLKPGRSWTAKVLAAVPGLFDKNAGDAVKRAVDRAGQIWHATLLWDRVADLQMGLYVGLRDKMLAKGMNERAAQITAAHLANRYAGTLPREAMSEAARKIANLTLFSRTFTLGNLGALKDAVTGLPKDAQAQILRDAGAETLNGALKYAKRKARATVLLDIGLGLVANSLLQSSLAILRGDSSLDKEAQGYVRRLQAEMLRIKENPMELINAPSKISATADNEPGKQNRVLVGHASDGTAIYMRNPLGKLGEEFSGWMTAPLDTLKAKLSTFAKPMYQTLTNDKGFGQHVFDPEDDTAGANARRLGRIVSLFIGSQLPTQALQGAADWYQGKGDATLNAGRVLGPLAGLTFSKGAPGGEAVGELYHAREKHEFDVQQALPAIRDKIRGGNIPDAVRDMVQLGINPKLAEYYIKTTLNPSLRLSAHQLQEFMQYASPEQRSRMQMEMQNRQ